MPRIRPATPGDVPAIMRIYGHAVRTSVATFDLVDPPADYWDHIVAAPTAGDYTLVAERAGEVCGYAYSSPFRPRPGYARTKETSVYLAPDAVGAGLGTRLYTELLTALAADGMHAAVAVVAQPNPASDALHLKLGFRPVGTLREVGHKFGQWVDTTWYQLLLAHNFPGRASGTPSP